MGDTADTQPLDAVSFKALAESYQPPALPPVKRFEETDDHVLQRSLQTEFGRADAAGWLAQIVLSLCVGGLTSAWVFKTNGVHTVSWMFK